jgi:aminopeptidase N
MKYLNTKSIPKTYNLFFNINILNAKFDGYNLIELEIKNPTDMIQFHGLDLVITEIELNHNKKYYSNDFEYDSDNDMWTLYLDQILEIGTYNLKIMFEGLICTSAGLVRYNYKAKSNRTLIFTRFEPNFARKCFPCWDEPHVKVIYKTTIKIDDPSYQVYFNTDPYDIQKTSTSAIYKFEPTIPMSTYVSSFMIGKFYYIEAYTKKNIRLRVYIPSDVTDSEHLGYYALESGIKVIDFATDYYKVEYPFNKMDFIPIDNVDAKGMENYGLIFYDAPWLLYDKKISTIDHKIGITNVIAHEIAHQWFGNLITMYRWDELWLKESFAKFFEYYIVDKIYPEWDIKSFYIKNLFRTLEFDSISLKSIKTKVTHNKHLFQIYDDVTYFKGATLLFMLLDYLGEDHFKSSIRSYLAKYKYSTITSNSFMESLCENLDSSTQIQIKEMIQTYISNKGVPIVKFDTNNLNIIPFNTRNLINSIINDKVINFNNLNVNSPSNIEWTIPIRIAESKYLLSKSNSEKIHSITKDEPIMNCKDICYYRVLYTDKQFEKLLKEIPNTGSKQHMSILNDLYILGIYSLSDFSNWIRYINKLILHMLTFDSTNQFSYYLISSICQTISSFEVFLKDKYLNEFYQKTQISTATDFYKKFLKKPLKHLIEKMSHMFKIFDINTYTNRDLSDDNIHHNKLVFFLLDINKSKSKKFINYLFENQMFNLYGDLNIIIFKHIIQNNNSNDINKLEEIAESNPDLYQMISMSFRYTKNKLVIENIMKQLKNENQMGMSHGEITQYLVSNKYFAKLYTDFFMNNYDDYVKIFPLDSKGFAFLLNHMIQSQTDPIILEQLLNKLYSIDNTKFILKMTQAKNILFNKLFTKITVIKMLKNINHDM